MPADGVAATMELHTPKRESRPSAESLDGSPSMCDTTLYPWNWGEEARNVNLSPGSSCSSPEYREQHVAVLDAGGGSASGRSAAGNGSESHRRGRPRADALTNLMKQGSTSPSSIKCTYCNRVFPREKSLQAHLRTHTGKGRFLPRYQRRENPRGFIQPSGGGRYAIAPADRDGSNPPARRDACRRARHSFARASRQSAIMPCFKYLNGSPRVPAKTHGRVPDSAAGPTWRPVAREIYGMATRVTSGATLSCVGILIGPAVGGGGRKGRRCLCTRSRWSVTTRSCAVFVYGQQKKDAAALFRFCGAEFVERRVVRKCCDAPD